MAQDLTTLICLFHSKAQAHGALEDLLKAGIPESNITLVGDAGSQIAADASTLAELNVPDRDRQHLMDGLKDGGVVLTVSAISTDADKVDSIFKSHSADKIDEDTVADDMSGVDTLADAAEATDTTVQPGDDVLLVEDEANRTVYVYRRRTVTAANTEDVDPRELGLDERMAPVPDDERV